MIEEQGLVPQQEQPLELVAPSALEAMERAQVDVQISTAKKYPRSMQLFQRRALTMVSIDEETAASCIYRRPVGKKLNKSTGKWEEEFAEGESIRLAEIVAASYGNIRVAAKIVEQTERYVKCVGLAHDLESNYASQSEAMESTVKKDGTPYSENMRTVVAKATLSKAWRDALFRVVPKSLCKQIADTAKKIAIGDASTLDKRRKKVEEWINKAGIDAERVWERLGVKGIADITLEHLEILTGLKTAMKDGDITMDEAFPPVAKRPGVTDPTDNVPMGNTPAETAATAQPETKEQPIDRLQKLMKAENISEAQMLAYAKHIQLAKPVFKEINQMADAKLTDLANRWTTILPDIKATKI